MNSVTHTQVQPKKMALPPMIVEEDEYELWMRIWADISRGGDPAMVRLFARYLPNVDEEELGGGD